jgi:hypothetical protein
MKPSIECHLIADLPHRRHGARCGRANPLIRYPVQHARTAELRQDNSPLCRSDSCGSFRMRERSNCRIVPYGESRIFPQNSQVS